MKKPRRYVYRPQRVSDHDFQTKMVSLQYVILKKATEFMQLRSSVNKTKAGRECVREMKKALKEFNMKMVKPYGEIFA